MRNQSEVLFKLADETGSLGLHCTRDGLTLAGVPLLRRDRAGFAPRPIAEIERLIRSAYGLAENTTKMMGGLGATARALNDGDMCRAMIAAVHLKLPTLSWNNAARLAQTESVLAKYSADQPRDWHGRWTTGDGTARGPVVASAAERGDTTDAMLVGASTPHEQSADDDWVHLPPGERNDEIGDLLEWIANAKPKDEAAIRGEIRRLFYAVGDTHGGNMLNVVLTESLRLAPGDKRGRQDLLSAYEYYAHVDPAEMAQVTRDLVTLGLSAPLSAVRTFVARIPETAAAVPEPAEVSGAVATAAASDEAVASEVWKLGWGERGMRISRALGANLADNFPVIDTFANGIATSIKSIDLNAATYRNGARLLRRLNTYVDQVAKFNGAKWSDREILANEIAGRTLNVAIPMNSGIAEQRAAIEVATERAKSVGVELIITPF